MDFNRHYSFKRGEPIPFKARLSGRVTGVITGELIFDGMPAFFQVLLRHGVHGCCDFRVWRCPSPVLLFVSLLPLSLPLS